MREVDEERGIQPLRRINPTRLHKAEPKDKTTLFPLAHLTQARAPFLSKFPTAQKRVLDKDISVHPRTSLPRLGLPTPEAPIHKHIARHPHRHKLRHCGVPAGQHGAMHLQLLRLRPCLQQRRDHPCLQHHLLRLHPADRLSQLRSCHRRPAVRVRPCRCDEPEPHTRHVRWLSSEQLNY